MCGLFCISCDSHGAILCWEIKEQLWSCIMVGDEQSWCGIVLGDRSSHNCVGRKRSSHVVLLGDMSSQGVYCVGR